MSRAASATLLQSGWPLSLSSLTTYFRRPSRRPAGASCFWAAVGGNRIHQHCVVIAAGFDARRRAASPDKLWDMVDSSDSQTNT
jgi:hypothetical protein